MCTSVEIEIDVVGSREVSFLLEQTNQIIQGSDVAVCFSRAKPVGKNSKVTVCDAFPMLLCEIVHVQHLFGADAVQRWLVNQKEMQ